MQHGDECSLVNGPSSSHVVHVSYTENIIVTITGVWALDRVHNSSRSLDRLLHFVTLLPWSLTFWSNINWWVIDIVWKIIHVHDFSFNRFGFIVWTESQTWMIAILTRLPTAWVITVQKYYYIGLLCNCIFIKYYYIGLLCKCIFIKWNTHKYKHTVVLSANIKFQTRIYSIIFLYYRPITVDNALNSHSLMKNHKCGRSRISDNQKHNCTVQFWATVWNVPVSLS